MAGVTRSLEEIASITILVPLFPSSWKEWYIQTIKRPDTGRKNSMDGWDSRKPVAQETPMEKSCLPLQPQNR